MVEHIEVEVAVFLELDLIVYHSHQLLCSRELSDTSLLHVWTLGQGQCISQHSLISDECFLAE